VEGGPSDDSSTGAVWVFTRANGVWAQKAKLVGAGTVGGGPQTGSQLGESVAVSNDAGTIIAGAWGGTGPGAAWVFVPVSGGAPAPGGVTPFSGSGMNTSLTFTFNDPRGWQDLGIVNVLINSALDGTRSCYLAYSQSAGALYLVADNGASLLTLNPGGSVANSQCSVSSAGTTASGNGNTLTLTLNLSFIAAFAGNKIVYTAARDVSGGNSGWQALGVWQVPGFSTFPAANSVTLPRGTGTAASLTFQFSDTKGAQDLGVVNVLVNSALDGGHACYIAYSQTFKVLYLVNDSGTGLSNALTLGGQGSVSNSQCTVNASGSSATLNGNQLTLVLNISFINAFGGNRIVYAAARDSTDANNSGWQALGTWSVQ
jgi:hypothetical protein